MSGQYDVLIVGAGIAGSALAHALSTITSKLRASPLRVALLERSLAEPDRIVGELLQPAGVASLQKLGLESCLEGIDAIPEHGYCVTQSGQIVHIPYPDGRQGRSFHHGRFVMALREHAKRARGVDVVEATVNELIECQHTKRVLGVRATRPNSTERESFFADLVIIADGCFSNFRNAVMGKASRESSTKSHFCGVILKDTQLPIPQHGTVALVQGHGPVLLYQISEHDTRMLVAVKHPVPHDLKGHIVRDVVPQLPASLHVAVHEALGKDRIRRMPNSLLPAVEQGGRYTKEGAILLGDAWNMRHPLTGGGMTVALHDVVILSKLLAKVDFRNWDEMSNLLRSWYWSRKPLASTINILSFALYDLFGADGEHLAVLQRGCFKYLERGGECVRGPVSLLAGISPSPSLLAYHFFAVAFYSIWVMFFHPRPVVSESNPDKPLMVSPQLWDYPGLAVRGIKVFWTACVVFGPLLWSEIRWW
ncbi:squalene epoxidase-domain-containing protein [Pisolithus thermaeus]|nr:squalene epoxidase-domain-containing protein [Pisolithus croceorrhizus]KAI6161535.1 squalene epoxidase-domain-containing protein [Pisolithus thermaeus]